MLLCLTGFTSLAGLSGCTSDIFSSPDNPAPDRRSPAKTSDASPHDELSRPVVLAQVNTGATDTRTGEAPRAAGSSTGGLTLAASIVVIPTNARTLVVDGATGSDTNAGTTAAPMKTISKAASMVQPGDVVLIRPGTYREHVAIPRGGTAKAPIVFHAEQSGTVVVSGSDVLTDLKKESDGSYSTPWANDFFTWGKPVDGKRPRNPEKTPAPIGCAEQVFVDGKPLKMVLSRDELKPGHFFVDWDADRLYLRADNDADVTADRLVEASVRNRIFTPASMNAPGAKLSAEDIAGGKSPFIHVKNLTFRHCANFAQLANSAVVTDSGWRMEDCVIEYANGVGMAVRGQDVQLLRVIGQYNANSGIGGAQCKDVYVKDSIVRGNNWKGYNPSHEAGGGKWVRTTNVVIDNHTSYDNVGTGIWFDIANKNYTIKNSTVYNNRGLMRDGQGNGIFAEINDGPGLIENNTCYGNTGDDILVSESHDVVVRGNTVINGRIGFRDAPGRGINIKNVTITGNTLKNSIIRTTSGQWDAKSPETKGVTIDHNLWTARQGQTLLLWGRKQMKSIDEVRTGLGFEKNGQFTLDTTPDDGKGGNAANPAPDVNADE